MTPSRIAAFFLAIPLLLLSVTMALAETVDFNPAVNSLTDLVTSIVIGLLFVLAAWLAMTLKKKWGIDITAQVAELEANYRATLHSAVKTWTDAAIVKYGPNLKLEVGSPALAFILEGVARSAPDAIAKLKPTEAWIIAKASGLAGVTPPQA